jgi:phosphotransferase system HPr-like phosphotransfer protein
MIDGADDVETIGHHARIGEMLAYQRTIVGRQVHTHHLHAMLAWQTRQITFQRGLTAPQHDIVDLVMLQIAKGSSIAVATGEEVLVDAQHLRTWAAGALARQPLTYFSRCALHFPSFLTSTANDPSHAGTLVGPLRLKLNGMGLPPGPKSLAGLPS